MLEVNDAKVAIVHEIGLVTNICKMHNPQNGQIVYNITIIHAGGTCMFATTKELFEQWVLGIHKCVTELDDKKIVVPNMQALSGGRNFGGGNW